MWAIWFFRSSAFTVKYIQYNNCKFLYLVSSSEPVEVETLVVILYYVTHVDYKLENLWYLAYPKLLNTLNSSLNSNILCFSTEFSHYPRPQLFSKEIFSFVYIFYWILSSWRWSLGRKKFKKIGYLFARIRAVIMFILSLMSLRNQYAVYLA